MKLIKIKDKGWGVFTLSNIKKGNFICEYIGEVISDDESIIRFIIIIDKVIIKKRQKEYDKEKKNYMLIIKEYKF